MEYLASIAKADGISKSICDKKNIINNLLLKKNQHDYNKVIEIINIIKKTHDIENKIDIIFSTDIRNGKILNERLNHVELIISPIFKKENLEFLDILYNTMLSKKEIVLCDNWSLVKFKPWDKKSLETINIEYKNNNESIIITHNDIKYSSTDNKKHNLEKIDITLFIDNKVQEYLLQKHNINGNDVLIPRDSSILALMDAAIGEYNMLNIVNHISICINPSSNNNLPLKNLSEKIQMIDTIINTKNKIQCCLRCGYLNTHVKLVKCKCDNVYYCDNVCKNAHADIHNQFCN